MRYSKNRIIAKYVYENFTITGPTEEEYNNRDLADGYENYEHIGMYFGEYDYYDYWGEVAEINKWNVAAILKHEWNDIVLILFTPKDEDEIIIEMFLDWEHDGSETKPVTIVNGTNFGRCPVWEDDPKFQAEELKELFGRASYFEEPYNYE